MGRIYKYLIIALFLIAGAFAQEKRGRDVFWDPWGFLYTSKAVYAMDLDGTEGVIADVSPSLDLNGALLFNNQYDSDFEPTFGSEEITVQNNRDFSSRTVGDWYVYTDGSERALVCDTLLEHVHLVPDDPAGTYTGAKLDTPDDFVFVDGTSYIIQADVNVYQFDNIDSVSIITTDMSNGSYVNIQSADQGIENDWQTISTIWTAGSDVTGSIAIMIWTTVDGEYLYYDDVSIKEYIAPSPNWELLDSHNYAFDIAGESILGFVSYALSGDAPDTNIVTNGTFDADTDWTYTVPGWAWNSWNGGTLCADIQIGTDGYTTQLVPFDSGASYTVSFDMINYNSGLVKVKLGSTGTFGTTRTANGTYVETLTHSGNDTLYIFGTKEPYSEYYIDNVIVSPTIPVETEDRGIKLAAEYFEPLEHGKEYTFSLRISEGVGDFLVAFGDTVFTLSESNPEYQVSVTFNWDTTGNSSPDIILYFDGDGDNYIDNIDLSEAYDMTLNMWMKYTLDTDETYMLFNTMPYEDEMDIGWYFYMSEEGGEVAYFSCEMYEDEKEFNFEYEYETSEEAWHLYSITMDHSATLVDTMLKLYIDGVYVAGEEAEYLMGTYRYTNDSLLIGTYLDEGNPGEGLIGKMGEVQYLRGLATPSELLRIVNTKRSMLRSYTNAIITSWWKWAGDTDSIFLKDEQETNNLIEINVDQANDQIKLNKYTD